jgi:transcriptional regulator with XRE-family HTH domain
LDILSGIMDGTGIHAQIAAQVRRLRAARRLSLAALGAASGVSRSMISLVERGEASPTAVVLERLATGLGVPLAALFDAPREPGRAPAPLARRAGQLRWRDPGSGYLRRNVSPPNWPSPIRIVEVRFPPGARVAYENSARGPAVHQQVWVLAGRIEITCGTERHRLRPGDCLAMQLDRPIVFANRTRAPARYVVVLAGASAGEAA